MKIPLKYRTKLVGQYNPAISSCPNYECDFIKGFDSMDWFVGFTDEFVVCECPKCFTKWYYHHRGEARIRTILRCLKFKPTKP